MEEDIKIALDVLRKGGIILYPTDTVWGIGCDATNNEAVDKIYKIKGRHEEKAMLSLVSSVAMLERYVGELPEIAEQLIEVTDKPLTIIYDNVTGIATNLTAPDGSAGFRVTSERFSNELCRRLGKPIVSTSANISGTSSPQIFDEIDDKIIESVDYLVKYRQDDLSHANPSSVIKISSDGTFKILRG